MYGDILLPSLGVTLLPSLGPILLEHTCSSAGLSRLTARPVAVRRVPCSAALSVVPVLSSSGRRYASSLHWTSGIKLSSVPCFYSFSSLSVASPLVVLRRETHCGFSHLSLRLPYFVVYKAMFLFSSVAPLPALVFRCFYFRFGPILCRFCYCALVSRFLMTIGHRRLRFLLDSTSVPSSFADLRLDVLSG